MKTKHGFAAYFQGKNPNWNHGDCIEIFNSLKALVGWIEGAADGAVNENDILRMPILIKAKELIAILDNKEESVK